MVAIPSCHHLQQCKITHLLHETLAIMSMLDDNILSQWSQQKTAFEFCAQWKKQQMHDH